MRNTANKMNIYINQQVAFCGASQLVGFFKYLKQDYGTKEKGTSRME